MKVLFAGPSLHRDLPFLKRHHVEIDWRGPAHCGDIAGAVLDGATAIGVIDGLFDQNAAPWHKEILFALTQGVRVAGGASMGALRAAECRAFGMVGIGAIYRRYAVDVVTDDADVAQLHGPEELNYLPLTEPWVNVEPSLERLEADGVVAPASVRHIVAAARRLHYTERTYQEILRHTVGIRPAEAEAALRWLRDHAIDQKRIDALEVLDWLREQPETRAGGDRANDRPWQLQETTQWLELLRTLGRAA
ncbi:MAG TPA: TfuA-like protein [Candidatus Cybelea sp.]|nr:TfuA-like protein [Candidatus Cybelea sp.]